MPKNLLVIAITAAQLLLAGCATHVDHNRINNNFKFNLQNAAKINKLQVWTMHGKISWVDKKNNQSAICSIKWVKNYNRSYITLSSVMNLKRVDLEIENNKIKIVNNSNNIVQQDIENIIDNISLNIENLSYWTLGVPNPKYKYELIENGFRQQNVLIKYLSYNLYDYLFLPAKIAVNSNDVNIKIIIHDFMLR